MPEKIIFLDVDGVLNYRNYINDETNDIDPLKVQMIADLCDKTNANNRQIITTIMDISGTDTHSFKDKEFILKLLSKKFITKGWNK